MIAAELLTRLGFQVDQTGINKGKSALQEFKSFALRLGIGTALALIGKTAVATAAELESMQAQFEVMLGSAEKAAGLMKTLRDYAAATSFETGDVTNATMTMMQFGMSQEDAVANMKRLGDVAGSNKERFKSLSLALAQVNAAGRLQGQDLLQLVNAGWNPLKAISEKTGRSMAQLKKDMEKGKISYEMVEQALTSVTSKGGMFYNNQLKQSKTLIGLWSTMVDNLKLKLAEMANAVMPLMKSIIDFIGQIDFSPLVTGFRWLSAAIIYVAQVMWASGLQVAWVMLKDAFVAFLGALGQFLGGDAQNFGSTLQMLAVGLARVVVFLAMVTTGIMQVVTWTLKWLPELKTLLGIFTVLLPIMLALWGPGMAARIGLFTWAVKLAGFAELFFARAALAGGAAVGYKVTMLGTLKAALFGVTNMLARARLGMAAFAATTAGTMAIAFAAIAAVGFAVYSVWKAVQEKREFEQGQANEEKKAAITDQILENTKEWRKARDRGDRATMELMEQRIRERRHAYHALSGEAEKQDALEGMPSFEAMIQAGDNQAQIQMQKIVDQGNKTTNINNKTDVVINAPVGESGKTGLGAGDLAKLAEQTFRSSFSIELRRVLAAGV